MACYIGTGPEQLRWGSHEAIEEARTSQTIEFVQTFDKFFDCLNVSSLEAGKHSRNVFKSPYNSKDDFKIKVNRKEKRKKGK